MPLGTGRAGRRRGFHGVRAGHGRRSRSARRSSGGDVARAGWWRHAVIYQVYPRSFADGNGDGIGDLAGVRSRLPYLADLGIDAIWFTPWYRSPLADGGYDVADYRAIDPAFGTLEEAEALIAEAAALGIRTIVDVVPNHVSDQHPWFQAALAAAPGSPERDRFWFRPGQGTRRRRDADELAEQLRRARPGRARRTRTARPASGTSTSSPRPSRTSTGTTPTSAGSTRTSSASGSTAASPASASTRRPCWSRTRRCPRCPSRPGARRAPRPGPRRAARDLPLAGAPSRTATTATRILVGELWLPDLDRFALYLRPDELHTAFNFDFLARPWDAAELRASIDLTLAAHAPVDAAPDVGPREPRRDPPRDALRAGRHLVRLQAQAPRHRRRTSRSAAGGRARRPCSPRPCRARSTSTRARSSASTRSRTCRSSS